MMELCQSTRASEGTGWLSRADGATDGVRMLFTQESAYVLFPLVALQFPVRSFPDLGHVPAVSERDMATDVEWLRRILPAI